MLFNTYEFMFAFLPLAWVAYFAAQRWLPSAANASLVVASLFFYAWWDIRFLPLFLGSVAMNFVLGRVIETCHGRGDDRQARTWMVVGVTANLIALGFFKYIDFVLVNLAAATGGGISPIGVILPIGISFFTFTQIAYLVDVRQGKSGHYNLVDYCLFVSFFPHLVAGPILHHREMMPQFARSHGPRAMEVAAGLSLFVAGLFKKVMIADSLASFASPVFGAADAGLAVTTLEAWGGALAYTFQIYFDFSGYSDMAIGLGWMFGIRLPINFHSPYKATSIIEFWRTWHMTLSRFLRDYLYFALGGNRKGPARRYVNLMLTMLLGGLWHGAGWGFVIWGALHGAYLVINHGVQATALGRWLQADGGGTGHRMAATALAWAATFLAVIFAWVFFRATNLDGALEMAGAMLATDGISVPADYREDLGGLPALLGASYEARSVIGLGEWVKTGAPLILVAGLLAILAPNTNQIFLSREPYYREAYPGLLTEPRLSWLVWRPQPAKAALLFIAFVVILFYPRSPSEFLYFQF